MILGENIPAIDLFAGPGGLAEGFARSGYYSSRPKFDVRLSIEKDPIAVRTLQTRALFRALEDGDAKHYYEYLEGRISRGELFEAYPEQANVAISEAWEATLGEASRDEVNDRILRSLQHADSWVLLGGPPCQVYSLVGRSRMRGNLGDDFDSDHRHFLYREYLQILADHKPPVFIFENVKGLLSSTTAGRNTFEAIVQDLRSPSLEFGNPLSGGRPADYELVPLTLDVEPEGDTLGTDFVIRAEQYGIPQKRHRVIIMGVRQDLVESGVLDAFTKLPKRKGPVVGEIIGGLPPLLGRLSNRNKDGSSVVDSLNGSADGSVVNWDDMRSDGIISDLLYRRIKKSIRAVSKRKSVDQGGFFRGSFPASVLSDWYQDSEFNGVLQHVSRSHMPSDLQRYIFASSTAEISGRSPTLKEYPSELLPSHESAASGSFNDRFRVQVAGDQATTITSHISKDGHYFIHPDPKQCRSLSLREAARLQTFPDNYYFEGNRTQQYVQVGNAVPPLLANQIADVVHSVLMEWTRNVADTGSVGRT